MRIITDGKDFAVAKGRWIFTNILSKYGTWWKINTSNSEEYYCWTSLEGAKERMRKYKRKWKDYHE